MLSFITFSQLQCCEAVLHINSVFMDSHPVHMLTLR